MADYERTNEEQLELFADLLEPVAEILSDGKIAEMFQQGVPMLQPIRYAIKNHKKSIIEILARFDGVDPAEYKVNLLTMPIKLLNLVNRPEVQELFSSQAQSTAAGSFGPATENIKDGAN